MEYYLPNNDNNSNNSSNNNNNNNNDNDNNNNNNNKTMMMIMIIIRMMTMMIIGTTTIMIMIIIITTTLTMSIMKMIMIKTAQTPCQSLYKDRRIQNKIAWYNWYNRDDVMLILYEMLHTCSLRILSTDASGCFFTNVTFIAVAEISIRRDFFLKSYHKFIECNLFFIHLILFWIDELIHLHSIYISSMKIEFHLWYENYRRHFQIYLQWKCLNSNYNFTEVCSQGSNWL